MGHLCVSWPLPRPRERKDALPASGAPEDVPTYELKTPLQRAIQLLKRHRDVMFVDNLDVAPISMILTNLAGHAYGGEAESTEVP
jgi:hypothetical protein